MKDISKRNILIIFAVRGIRSLFAGMLTISFSLYLYDVLRFPLYEIGAIFMAGAFFTPILSLIFGYYADAIGRKKILLINFLLMSLSIVLIIASRNYYALMAAAALGGLGTAGGLIGGAVGASAGPIMTALIAENAKRERLTAYFALNNMISAFAGGIGAYIAGLEGYSASFYESLMLSLLSIILALFIVERYVPTPRKATAETRESPRGRSGGPNYIKYFSLTGLLNGFSQGLVTPFFAIIFEVLFDLSKAQIGMLFSMGGYLTGLAYIFSPSLNRALGFTKSIIITRTLSATALLLLPLMRSAFLAEAMYLILTPLRAISLPIQSSLMMGLIGEEQRATGSGLNQFSRLMASAFSTVLGGFLLEFAPPLVPFAVSASATYLNSYLYRQYFSDVEKGIR
ncbi:MAG: MFS transporter [Nitrososphaeria archaeon]